MYKISFYIRASTEEQCSPEGTIKNQEQRLKALVDAKNKEENFGEIKNVFIDRARSGKDTNRPELKRLLESIERGNTNLVVVTELSRLSRNVRDFAEMWEMMQSKGCKFMSLRENFDTTTASGEFVLYQLAGLAQLEAGARPVYPLQRLDAGCATS